MIDWYSKTLYELCLTAGVTLSQVTDLKYSTLSLPSYPAHTQSVERLVKQTTRAAESVAGYSARVGFLRVSSKSREMMPRLESKKDFENNFL